MPSLIGILLRPGDRPDRRTAFFTTKNTKNHKACTKALWVLVVKIVSTLCEYRGVKADHDGPESQRFRQLELEHGRVKLTLPCSIVFV